MYGMRLDPGGIRIYLPDLCTLAREGGYNFNASALENNELSTVVWIFYLM